jgi:hypothetical protein
MDHGIVRSDLFGPLGLVGSASRCDHPRTCPAGQLGGSSADPRARCDHENGLAGTQSRLAEKHVVRGQIHRSGGGGSAEGHPVAEVEDVALGGANELGVASVSVDAHHAVLGTRGLVAG